MLKVYHLERSRSERVLWLLEELGLDYDLVQFQRQPDLYGPPEMRHIHPLGRAPVIEDGDTVLAESGAIIEYILARYGNGRLAVAPSAPDFARFLFWLHYAEGSFMLALLREWTVERLIPDADALPGMARIRDVTRLNLAMIEDALANSPYCAGEAFTAADIMMAYPLTTFRRLRPIDLNPYPAIAAWTDRVTARNSFHRALDRSVPPASVVG